MTQNKKRLKRIDWDIVVRMLNVLYCCGKIKKTIVARNSNMSYDNCILYLDWLELIGFIKKEIDDNGFEILILTDTGLVFYKTKLISELQSSASNLEQLSV